jgi:hypothetical protein
LNSLIEEMKNKNSYKINDISKSLNMINNNNNKSSTLNVKDKYLVNSNSISYRKLNNSSDN